MLSYAEARRIIRIYFGLVELYPVHPGCQGEAFWQSLVDPVRRWKDHYPSCSLDLSAYLIGKTKPEERNLEVFR
jgi:hypothetical protein